MDRRTNQIALLTLSIGGLVIPVRAAGQDVATRVATAPDGLVRLTYAARDGVCGNGTSISVDDRVYLRSPNGEDCACEEGPVRLEMRVRDGIVRDLEVGVGGDWRGSTRTVTDLGDVPPAEAADFLLDLAETAREHVAEDAIFPATIARDVETWPRLLDIARGDGYTEVRERAVFWLSQEASERATDGLVSIIEDEDELAVREHAVFALSQRAEPRALDALMRLARSSPEPELRRKAIFWLGQRGDDPRVLALLEEILTRGG